MKVNKNGLCQLKTEVYKMTYEHKCLLMERNHCKNGTTYTTFHTLCR